MVATEDIANYKIIKANSWHYFIERKFNWRRFFRWCFMRILFPLAPIIISFLAGRLFSFTFHFPDERVMFFSVLLPIFYIDEVDDSLVKIVLHFVALLCIVLYVFAVVANQPGIQKEYPDALQNIYNVGGFAFVIEVMTAVFYEIIRSFEANPAAKAEGWKA